MDPPQWPGGGPVNLDDRLTDHGPPSGCQKGEGSVGYLRAIRFDDLDAAVLRRDRLLGRPLTDETKADDPDRHGDDHADPPVRPA
jgi:hypothetical protein